MDKVLVIGGSGFLGSHTADVLSDKGFEVTIFDKIKSPWLKKDQHMIIGDLLNLEDLNSAISGSKYVYHFAGIADIPESKKNPLNTINYNIVGTSNVVEASINQKVERLLFASTMYVYSPYGSFYRATKQASEALIEVYSEEYELEYTFLRYGSLYGPRSQNWNTIKRYATQILEENKIDYMGTGRERREYIHVIDAAKLSVDILDNKYKNLPITVTGHQVLYADEMMDLIFEISGKKRKVNYINRDIDPDRYLNTPYRFTPKSAIKLVPDQYFDLGQGILEVIEEASKQK
tara:strand:+ start:1900 stop:2772 length:873 start_codon:yes stop_codon:yes gene_type:complete